MSRALSVPPRDVRIWERRIFPVLRAALAAGYFELDVIAADRVPSSGPVVFVGNHSGWFALDALIFNLALHDSVGPDRVTYAIVQDALLRWPGVRRLVAPLGVIPASLLRRPERLPQEVDTFGIFPEGVAGICKPFWQAYQMRQWRSGFLRLALARRARIVPCALVGGEECLPTLGGIHGLERWLGAPLPVPLCWAPLPTRWKIVFGDPIELDGVADGPGAAHPSRGWYRERAEAIRQVVQELLDRHTLERPLRRFGSP